MDRDSIEFEFQRLPDELQRRILKAANDFRSLTPEQRARYWGRELSPAEREFIRAQLAVARKGGIQGSG